VPRGAPRILDLGTGDGRLLAMLQADRPRMLGVGLDFSELMLDAARERFAGDERIEIVEHDLAEPLPAVGRFDAVVSSMAIHHLEHERKRSLLLDVETQLAWLRDIGFVDVDCYWKWLEMALLIAVKPTAPA
jgi:tRNA (cmo5U34)-methyltransferase